MPKDNNNDQERLAAAIARASARLGRKTGVRPDDDSARGLDALGQNITEYQNTLKPIPLADALGRPAGGTEVDRVNSTTRPEGEERIDTAVMTRPGLPRVADPDMQPSVLGSVYSTASGAASHLGSALPRMSQATIYDTGGEVEVGDPRIRPIKNDINDGRHQVAILESGERVLTPEQNQHLEHGRMPKISQVSPEDELIPTSVLGRARKSMLNSMAGTPVYDDGGAVSDPDNQASFVSKMRPMIAMDPSQDQPEVRGAEQPTEGQPTYNTTPRLGRIGDNLDAVNNHYEKTGDLVTLGKALVHKQQADSMFPKGGDQGAPTNTGAADGTVQPGLGNARIIRSSNPDADLIPPSSDLFGHKSTDAKIRGLISGEPATMPAATGNPAAYKARLKQYDADIQAGLDAGTPEGRAQAAAQKEARINFQSQHPEGSAENSPGVWGKIKHGLSEVGQIAGATVLGPGFVEAIPGTKANMGARRAGAEHEYDESEQQAEREQVAKNADETKLTGLELQQEKLNEQAEKNQNQNEAVLRKQGLRINPVTGKEESIPYSEMSPHEQGVEDLRAAQKEATEARAELDKMKGDPKSPLYQLQLKRLQVATQNGNNALARLGLSQAEFANKLQEQELLKPSGQAQSRSSAAQSVLDLMPGLEALVRKNADNMGPVMGRLEKGELKIGDVDPDVAELYSAMKSFYALQPAVHGFRNAEFVKDFETALGTLERNPDAFIAGMKGLKPTLESVAKEGKTFHQRIVEPTASVPGPHNNKYHYNSSKGEIFSNDGKTWYDAQGNKVGK
jgi:hypothetical protein